MANVTLGNIEIVFTHNNHTAGDFLIIYFDPDTSSYGVTEIDYLGNTSVITSPPYDGIYAFPSSNGVDANYLRTDRKVEIITGVNTITYFEPIEAFPFYKTKSR